MSDKEEKGEVEGEDTAAAEASTEAARVAVAGEEAAAEEVKEEKGEEAAQEEGKEAEAVEVPELSEEQVAALRQDPRFKPEEKAPEGLDAFVKGLLQEQEQAKETEQTQAAERKSVEDALKAYREDDDPAPLAQIAADLYDKAQEAGRVSVEAAKVVDERLSVFVEAEYGEQIRALKPEEVKNLDEMPLMDALKELNHLRVEAVRGESTTDKDAAGKAVRDAATAGAARVEGKGALPGGSAEEEVGDDIGTLMRQGMEDAVDAEEAVGG